MSGGWLCALDKTEKVRQEVKPHVSFCSLGGLLITTRNLSARPRNRDVDPRTRRICFQVNGLPTRILKTSSSLGEKNICVNYWRFRDTII